MIAAYRRIATVFALALIDHIFALNSNFFYNAEHVQLKQIQTHAEITPTIQTSNVKHFSFIQK